MGFPPVDLQSQSRAGIARDQDIMLAFAEHQSHLPILDKHLGLQKGSQTLISEFRVDISLNSSDCINFSEELSFEDLFVSDKTLNSNKSDDCEA